MQSDSEERGRLIAQFLRGQGVADKATALRVGEIARLPDCPIRPPREGEHRGDLKGSVGYEPHCQRVTSALDAASKLRLVLKGKRRNPRTGKPTGAWRYYYAEQLVAHREAQKAAQNPTSVMPR